MIGKKRNKNQKKGRYLELLGVHSRSNLTKNEVRMAWKWSEEWNSFQKVIKPLSFFDQSIFNILDVTVDWFDNLVHKQHMNKFCSQNHQEFTSRYMGFCKAAHAEISAATDTL